MVKEQQKTSKASVRVFLAGALVSNFALFGFLFAIGYYVVDVTGDAESLARFSTIMTIAMILTFPIAGVLIKGWKKKRVICASDFGSGVVLLAAVPFLITFKDDSSMMIIILSVLGFIVSIIQSFLKSAVGGAIPYVAKGNDIAKIVSVNGLIKSIGTAGGAVVGGLIYGLFEFEHQLIIYGSIFLISGFTEIFMKFPEKVKKVKGTRNIFKLYGKAAKNMKYTMNKTAGSTIMKIMLLTSICIPAYHKVINPYVVNKFLNYTGDTGAYYLSIFKLLTVIGALLASAFVGKFVKDRFTQRGVAVSLWLETPMMFVYAFAGLAYALNIFDAFTTFAVMASVMLFRTMFGSYRYITQNIGIVNNVDESETGVYEANFLLLLEVLNIPTFLLMGWGIDRFGIVHVLFAMTFVTLGARIVAQIMMVNLERRTTVK